MKTKNSLLLTCLLFLGLVLSKISMGQKGPSCDSAVVLSYPINNTVTSYTANAYWFKITLNTGNYRIKVSNFPGVGKIIKADVYTGTCSSLSLIRKDSIMNPADTNLYINIRNIGGSKVYYVKLSNRGGSITFANTMATELHIVGQIGFCPGQQVTLDAFPLNVNGTQTYTWLPTGSSSNASSYTVTPSNTVTPTTYTLIYNDNGGTLTSTVSIFPLGPDQCKNCEMVQNGHFEWYDGYPLGISNISDSFFWDNANIGSSDCFNVNFSNGAGVPANIVTTNTPTHNGNGYAGLVNYYANSEIREYIQSPLNCTLTAGQVYNVSFFTALADLSDVASNKIGAYLSATPIFTASNYYISGLTPPPLIYSNSVINYATSWTQISGNITGNNEQFITIGNFFDDASTTSAQSISSHSVAAYGGLSYYFVDDISVTPVPPTLTATTNTVNCNCVSNITLTATGSPSLYTTWSNGVNTYSGSVIPVPCPTATTIYTCTVNLPCAGCAPLTNTIAVNLIQNFTLSASASPTVICSGNSTTLTANGATSYTWMPGSITSSVAVVSPTATTIYTVTGAYGNCVTTQTVLVNVNANYCCQTPVITFTTGTISSQTTAVSYGAVLIAVNGTLTINTPNFTFTKTKIRMSPNSKIIIAPSCTVSLNGAHLFSCDYMWEGIEMSDNSRLITNKSTGFPSESPSIDDANIGIYSNASAMTTPGNISLNYLQLSKNHIGIKIENYTGASSYPFGMGAAVFQGNVSTAFSPGTTLKTYLSPSPINYPTTEYGVNLVNVNAASVGSTTGLRNTFKKMQHGVRMVNTNAAIIRNDFLDLTANYNNKAIWAVGSYVNSIPVSSPFISFGTKYRMSIGVGTSNNCSFKNLKNGIYADSCMTNYIQSNSFMDINGTGISVYRSNYNYGQLYNDQTSPPWVYLFDRDTTFIDNNNMKPLTTGANVMQNGIGMFDNYYMYSFVSNNTMTLNPASGVWSEGVGVYHASNNYYSAYSTLTNTIIGNGNYGVHEVNNAYNLINAVGLGGPRSIANNTITVGTGACSGFFNTPNVGVYSVNSPYAVIKENIIDETSLGAAPSCMIGIYISNGQQDYIGCNLMKNNSINCTVDQNNVNSTYRGNVMNTSLVGLYRVNGTMGDVGALNDAAQNEWYNTANNTFVASYVGPASNIYYDNSITARIPSVNGSNAAPPFNPLLTNTTTLGCTQYHKGGNGSYINPKDDNDGLISAIIQNNVIFPNYNQGLLWEHKNGILNLLKDSLIDNTKPLFAQFKQQNSNSKLGKINTLMRSLGNYADVAQNKNNYLQNLNSIGAATNVVEQNYKTFMSEYINNIMGATQINGSTLSTIKQLAQQCPYSDGVIVYNARALMKIWGDSEPYTNVCETITLPIQVSAREMIIANSNTKTQNVLVYPNPNNGTFNIAYTFEQSGNQFLLTDLMSRTVKNTILENSEGVKELNNTDLNNGVYFYKIIDIKGNMLFTGKLIINK